MEDAGNNFPPSKKRAAGVQLSRDNPGLDDDEETTQQEGGTFKRASDDVLATRRIVKVRRQQTSSIPSATAPDPASNPFAAIRLASAAVDVDASGVKTKETEKIDENENKSENEVDEAESKPPNSAENKADANDENIKQSESKVEESEAKSNAEKDETDEVAKLDKTISTVEEVTEGENIGHGTGGAAEADLVKTQTGNGVEGKETNVGKDNGEKDTEKNAETANFSSFQHLSSGQNAFSGLAGTGFSSGPFSFGSVPSDGAPTGSASGSLFSFGGPNNGTTSVFGATGASIISKNEGGKIAIMPEVPLETGEENEEAVFTADSVLFEFVDGSWKERGKGELKVNVSTTGTGKARLIMRARGNFRLILNAILYPEMKLTNMEKKGVTFACVNTATEGKDGLSTIALKFKDASTVEEFKAAVMEHKSKATITLKTPENSPKASDE